MSGAWAVRLSAEDAHVVSRLRLWPGVAVYQCDSGLWLRGHALSDANRLVLRGLPATERLEVADDQTITPQGRRVPTGKLPPGPWTPIDRWCELVSPTAAQPGEFPAQGRTPLTLVPDQHVRTPTVLVTDWATWFDWAQTVAEARLRPLRFARCEDGRTIIYGDPLPPIVGRRWVEQEGVAVPAGYCIEPNVSASALRALLQAPEGDMMVFAADATCETVPVLAWVTASRRAVRLTEAQRYVR